jgi:hypothetical protein
MATSAEARATVVNILKEGAASLGALNTAIAAAVADLDASSTDAEVQAAVTEWNAKRTAYADYGQIRLPDFGTLFSDVLADIATEAVP